MNLTKKRLVYLISVLVLLFFLGIVYVFLSSVKSVPQTNTPEIVLQNLIPSESTKEDLVRIKGTPDLITSASNTELLKYEVEKIDDVDIYAISNNKLSFYVENRVDPESFEEFSKSRGKGLEYYEEDDSFIWHIYPTKGIGVATIGKDIVRFLIFSPMNTNKFDDEIASQLGISKTPLIRQEASSELE